MRIVAKGIKARETTLGSAVSIVVDGDADALRDMMVRLLEELANNGTLHHAQLERVLAYKFNVLED